MTTASRLPSIFILLLAIAGRGMAAEKGPVVFWSPDQSGAGDATLLYGGGLARADGVVIWRLADANPGAPPAMALPAAPAKAAKVKPLQPTDNSLKFQIPEAFTPGVYGYQVALGEQRSAIRLLNKPELWFAQPTILQPGLLVNQLPPGAEFQIVGKNFTVRDDANPRPRVALKPKEGPAINLSMVKAEPFSLVAKLPEGIAAGVYQLFVHPGKGGPAAWSEPFAVEIKAAEAWPAKVFNVRDFGAKGNDVADDTKAVRDALEAAEKNGGGIVYFPWGTYRFTDYICIPERTTLRGEVRDATVLKWPLDAPKDEKDFIKAAIYIGSKSGIEDLTITGRRAEHLMLDVQYTLNYNVALPSDAARRVKPWGQSGDIFLRRLTVQHLLLASRPEQQKPVMDNPKLQKLYWEGLRNVMIQEGRNCEISDCAFEGGDNQFTNMVNARVTRNSFANHMGYCWTALGGGAIDVVCEGNDIKASSSWGWGWTGIQRVYSAHNSTLNFVRGEREAMTLDISSLPTARPVSQYWGTPIEVGSKEKPTLRFPAADQTNSDGFKTGWTPGIFKDGTVTIRAYHGGEGAGQSRKILDNTTDTLILEKPFGIAPETTSRKMYLEVAPRHGRAHNGTTAWMGALAESGPSAFTAKDAKWIPQEFVGMAAIVLDGKGAGQYRVIASNTSDHAALERAWDVEPDSSSVVGVWSLMRQMIVYDTKCTDASAFAQMYGAFYDYTVDNCRVDRTQGLWGQMGWFVQFRDNRVSYAHSYHPGIGMRGPNPEKNANFGYNGLDSHRIRITKTSAFQYPDRKMPLFADEAIGHMIPSTLGHIQRGNVYRYNQRIVVQPWTGESAPGPRPGGDLFRDVVLDGNTIEHSPVGIQLGANVGGALLSRNIFRDTARPTWLANPAKVLDLGTRDDGQTLFASGDLTGWVEEQHDFFKKKHPDAKTWSVKDGIVSCDGSLGNCGFLRCEKKYGDFTLRLEYRMSKECNSGVCIRVPKPYDGTAETLASRHGYEVQILDDHGAPPSLTATGSLYNAVQPEVNAARPAGEWNDLEIVCHGPRIRVTLNGVVVQDVDQTEVASIRERPRSGYIMLQNHGHATDFRNIRIKGEPRS